MIVIVLVNPVAALLNFGRGRLFPDSVWMTVLALLVVVVGDLSASLIDGVTRASNGATQK
jgi:hypothetical protein